MLKRWGEFYLQDARAKIAGEIAGEIAAVLGVLRKSPTTTTTTRVFKWSIGWKRESALAETAY